MNRPYNNRGFTLLELVVVMAIIAILAALVYPSYQEQMRKTYRGTEGMATLQSLATEQERYYSKNSSYTTDPTDLGFPADGMTPKGFYSISIEGSRLDGSDCDISRCFTITAAAAGAQVADVDCLTMKIDSTGAKKSAPSDTGCWR